MSVRKIGSFQLGKTRRLFQLQKRTLPKIIGNDAKNFFLEGFRKGGFTDKGLIKWAPRFKRLSRTRVSTTEREPSKLFLSGKLRRSVKRRIATFKRIVIGTSGITYASRHNLGLTDRLGRKMPQREFIGDSKVLEKKIERRIFKELDKVFK